MPLTTTNYKIPYAVASDNPANFPAEVDAPAAKAIDEQILKLNSRPPAIIKPTPTSPVTNYGGYFGNMIFVRDAQGIVHANGFLKDVPENGTLVTLPEGYRPGQQMNFERSFGRINITTNGIVSVTGTPANGWVMLGGCVWLAEK